MVMVPLVGDWTSMSLIVISEAPFLEARVQRRNIQKQKGDSKVVKTLGESIRKRAFLRRQMKLFEYPVL
jgi:hypothetical protein